MLEKQLLAVTDGIYTQGQELLRVAEGVSKQNPSLAMAIYEVVQQLCKTNVLLLSEIGSAMATDEFINEINQKEVV